MPELPEVETVRRGLEPAMTGKRLVRVEARRPDLRFPFPVRFVERLQGRRIVTLQRRAKYLLAGLDSGETLAMHLGMSGRFTVGAGAVLAHDHVVFHLSGGATVTYNDPRRFGFMTLLPTGEIATHKLFRALGPEPLSNAFGADHLATAAGGARRDLKALLMDQRVVAGLGNIYVCEALHRAGLEPTRSAATLADRRGRPTPRAGALARAIRDVLEEAIDAGGSSLKDFRHASGELGAFQTVLRVYDRAGSPCLRPGCGGTVRRLVQSGRATFHCPRCQR